MPKRTDIKSILIIGAGPIVIGQACEFDYSGAQACKALREEGYKVMLVNSNPATIMTDPEMADRDLHRADYLADLVEKIIAKERPDAILPTMGGQTALNCALDLARNGVLEKYKVELIGATRRRHRQSRRPRQASRKRWPRSAWVPARSVFRVPHHGRIAGSPVDQDNGLPDHDPSSRSRWAAPAAASPTTRKNSSSLSAARLEASPTSTSC